jgi:hypothetical protein
VVFPPDLFQCTKTLGMGTGTPVGGVGGLLFEVILPADFFDSQRYTSIDPG